MVKSEYFEKNNMDNILVCSYCGLEVSKETSYWCDICDEEAKPMTYFKWTEKIAEETMGNKEEYHKILDGSRM